MATSLSVAPSTVCLMIIDCQNCPGKVANECSDCVVTFLLDRPTELSDGEVAAMKVLADHGVVPELRLRAL